MARSSITSIESQSVRLYPLSKRSAYRACAASKPRRVCGITIVEALALARVAASAAALRCAIPHSAKKFISSVSIIQHGIESHPRVEAARERAGRRGDVRDASLVPVLAMQPPATSGDIETANPPARRLLHE